METPKLNNQPKAEVEKTPQENKGLLNEQEQESGKRENITLEIDGQKIEAVKYYFEYPERIQKETGILGYERVKISDQKLLKQVENALPQNKADVIVDICKSLSDGEYPNYTLNHIIGAYTTKNEHREMYEDFKKDKFFIQKIFGSELIERKRNRNNIDHREIFNHSPNGPSRELGVTYSLINKKNYKLLKTDFIGNFGKDQTEINEDNFAITLAEDSGLNVVPGHFFGQYPKKNEVAFGFSTDGQYSFFREYIKKALIELTKIKQENEKVVTDGETVRDIFGLYLLQEYSRKNGFPDKNTKEDNWSYANKESLRLLNLFLSENKLTGSLTEGEKLYLAKRMILSYYGNFYELHNKNGLGAEESILPIVFGHDEVPQLSWGHAKYAHYFNDKSFNFFKFKHADHLPVKEETNSSDS